MSKDTESHVVRDPITAEREIIGASREVQSGDYSALCLSGGGIRSATFALGVISALARHGWLDKFDYLSTVSGGGYIGAWLTAWRRHVGLDQVVKELRDTPARAGPVVALRRCSNYLSPGHGLSADTLALVFIYVRNLLVQWSLLLPVLLVVTLLPLVHYAGLSDLSAGPSSLAYAGVLVLIAIASAYVASDLPHAASHQTRHSHFLLGVLLPLGIMSFAGSLLGWVEAAGGEPSDATHLPWLLGLALMVSCLLGATTLRRARATHPGSGKDLRPKVVASAAFQSGALAAFSVLCVIAYPIRALLGLEGKTPLDLALVATFATPALLMLLALLNVPLMVLLRGFVDEGTREWWGRAGGLIAALAIAWIVAHAIILWLPPLLAASKYVLIVGGGATGAGLISVASAYWGRSGAELRGNDIAGALERWGVSVRGLMAGLFVLTVFTSLAAGLGIGVANWEISHSDDSWRPALDDWLLAIASAHGLWLPLLIFLVLAAGVMLMFAGVNTFSLSHVYGNRLCRAYLGAARLFDRGASDSREPHAFTGFDPRDDMNLHSAEQPALHPLYPVMNATLNLTATTRVAMPWYERIADSFILSPLALGSRSTGYRRLEGAYRGLSLGRSMAISGAAASPNMGFHTSRLLAFVLAFFNLRLGWWLHNPKCESGDCARFDEPASPWRAFLAEMTASSSAEGDAVYLSDGAHFDNLGLYEMIRRECKRIVVVDSGCDPESTYEDLERVLRHVRADFGTEIHFDRGLPSAASIARTGYWHAVGTIAYSTGLEGRLIYIKPGLSGKEPADLAAFARQSIAKGKAFPHESTMDQFFNEAQFESYRKLGELAADRMVRDTPWNSFEDIERPDHLDLEPQHHIESSSPLPTSPVSGGIGRGLSRFLSKFTWDTAPLWLALGGSPFIAAHLSEPPRAKPAGEILIIAPFPGGSAQYGQGLFYEQIPVNSGETDIRIMLPIFDEARGCAGTLPCETGHQPSADVEAFVERLANKLRECDAPATAQLVGFRVKGYASSADFRDIAPLPESEQRRRNMHLANARATAIHGLLKNVPNTRHEPVLKWTDPNELHESLYEDRTYENRYVGTLGALNRRVDLEFESLGRCSLQEIWGALRKSPREAARVRASDSPGPG